MDGETVIAEPISGYFNLFEMGPTYVTGHEERLVFLEDNTMSTILLDINLGEQSGFTLCKRLGETADVPILFISARASSDDTLTVLDVGGGDYIRKPCTLDTFLARVKAVLKRCVATNSPKIITLHHIEIGLSSRKVTSDKVPVKLEGLEFKLLVYLTKNRNRVIIREESLQNVWSDPCVGEGTLTVHIRHLGEELEQDPSRLEMILTV